MKPGIHPNYEKIKVIMTDGTEFETYSTMGKPGEVSILRLDIDSKSHPAWTGKGGMYVNENASQVSKFNKKFNFLGGSAGGKKAEAKPAEAAAPAETKAEGEQA